MQTVPDVARFCYYIDKQYHLVFSTTNNDATTDDFPETAVLRNPLYY